MFGGGRSNGERSGVLRQGYGSTSPVDQLALYAAFELALSQSVAQLRAIKALITSGGAGTVNLSASTLAALESITAVGPLTNIELRASPVPVSDGGSSLTVDGPLTSAEYASSFRPTSITSTTATPASSGDNTIVSVSASQQIRLWWISCQSDPASAAPIINVKIGATEHYRGYGVVQHFQRIQGATGDDLVVNLSAATSTTVTAHYELIAV